MTRGEQADCGESFTVTGTCARSRQRVGNRVYPSADHWGIPLLDIGMQAEHVEAPVLRWGREHRKSRMRGTWHFYVDDARFMRLWQRPEDMATSGAYALVEANFSVHAQTPRAVALYQTYRKRWLARTWQEMGFRVFVDLNVDPEHRETNLLGVPHGWRAYATRGSVHRLDAIADELSMARTHAGRSDVLFVVYGGGKAVEQQAQRLGVVWIPEEQDVINGRAGRQKGHQHGAR